MIPVNNAVSYASSGERHITIRTQVSEGTEASRAQVGVSIGRSDISCISNVPR